ncbi:MAG: hypothetical protein JWP87_2562 [Labilithrix sp.]|nr:hypothetical protein [Labilithrix sp.]
MLLPSTAVALVFALVAPASAQGTMTPSQPAQPPPAGTPSQPPPPPPVAQEATAPEAVAPAQSTEPPVEEKLDAPKARTGFQIAVRTGVAVPLGNVQEGGKMSDAFGVQVPLVADIGGKVIPNLFIGGYLGISFGGVGDSIKALCDNAAVDCTAVGFRFGVQAQLHILPAAKLNPWIGYGIGYEIAGASGSKNNNKLTSALGGVEFAHIMAGFDYRINKVVGIGPFADFALGQYSIASVETTIGGNTIKTDGDIAKTSLHEWLLAGVKVTFFP